MTDCEQVLRDLDAYLDGELAPARARDMESHLGECSPCGDRGEFARKLREVVRSKCGGHADLPAGLDARIRRTLEGPISPGPLGPGSLG